MGKQSMVTTNGARHSKDVMYGLDVHTQEIVSNLRVSLNLEANSDVLEQAIMLLYLATRTIAKGGAVHFVDKEGRVNEVVPGKMNHE